VTNLDEQATYARGVGRRHKACSAGGEEKNSAATDR
jgi:hypothetical protein